MAHKIGTGTLIFIRHKSNKVDYIAFDKLKKILLGDITNWKELGGIDAPIIVTTEYKGGGMRAMVEKEYLNNGEIKARTRDIPNGYFVKRVTADMKNAIGFMSAVLLDDSVLKVMTDNEITQPLYLVTKGNPNALQQKIIDAARFYADQK